MELEAQLRAAEDGDKARLGVELTALRTAVRSEKLGEVAAEFEAIHNIQRAQQVGSVDAIVPAVELRPQIIAAVERDEWQAAFILNKQRPPKKPPGVNDIVRLVAMLGGFLGRKGDGEPGVKTIWIGLQRVMDFAAGLRYARSEHDDE